MKTVQTDVGILFCVVLLLVSALPAAGGYTIVPMQFSLNARPGETVTQTMKAENVGEEPVSIAISTRDFMKGPYGEEQEVPPGSVERGCADWIRVAPQQLDLAPQETGLITFSMTIPLDGEGTYWGNILVSQVSKPTLNTIVKQGETSFQIFALQDMLIRILETVPGTEQKAGAIIDISAQDIQDDGRAIIEVAFENQGNSLLKCQGALEIRDGNGDTVQTIPLEYGHAPFTVYPGDERIVYAPITETLPPGDYILLTIIDYGGDSLVAGEMEWSVGEGQPE